MKKLMESLTAAVSYMFRDDKTCPNVAISLLKNGQHYVSVVRFDGAFAHDKEVVFKAVADDMEEALKSVAMQVISQPREANPLDLLQEMIAPPIRETHDNVEEDKNFNIAMS